MSFKPLAAILMDRDMDVRMRLKQATSSVSSFGKVHQATKPEEALDKLRSEGPVDVVFISYQYERQQISDFIKAAKADLAGQDTAYVLVLKRKGESNAALAEYMLTGADGFLFEPFSVDELVEITALATRVKKERLVRLWPFLIGPKLFRTKLFRRTESSGGAADGASLCRPP